MTPDERTYWKSLILDANWYVSPTVRAGATALHPQDGDVKSAMTPEQIVAMTIWGESRAEPVEGQIAVGCVIQNRLRFPVRFGSTWKDACLRPWQFSCWIPQGGVENYNMLIEHCALSLEGTARWPKQAMWIASGLLDRVIYDRVAGATHYYASWMRTPPIWAAGQTPVAILGVHRFYRGV